MRALFIGGTGIISTACTRLAADSGIEMTLLTRGLHKTDLPAGVRTLHCDIDDPASTRVALHNESFDVVVDWIAFTPDHIERDLRLFEGKTRQFIFISSASAYQKPPAHYLITESTPLANPFWDYARNKIACEERLLRAYRETGFPVTIVRPSLTYGDTQVALVMNSWTRSYTAIARMKQGRKVVVPGDGSSLWTITHNTDFAKGLVGLMGHPQAIGQAFHITTDEVLTWDQIVGITAEAVGVEPHIVHVPSDFIGACLPDRLGGLLGDKAVSAVFDNSKLKSLVPTFTATTPYAQGIRQTLAWFDADPARQLIDTEADTALDRLIDAYESGTAEALRRFQSLK
ncbi:MAG: SDR family oxidoreductase [Bryobacterales bacterium]|nr:SDR family oxidoreductase [Bryobacterales bacterium]